MGAELAQDAIDVARREAEGSGLKVVGTARPPHRGTIPGTWVVALLVEKRR